jgi:glutamyl-tRNA synthetase
MGVTHIMRADEFIASMPKFLSIYDALGFDYPIFVTLPPILRDDRTKKLGKRDGAKDILDYKEDGYLSSAMMNFLALTGWNPGTEQEMFTPTELISAFDITKIQRAGAAFNEDKLLWMNRQHLNNFSAPDYITYLQTSLPERFISSDQYSAEKLTRLIPNIRERVNNLVEFNEAVEAGEYDFAFFTPTYDTDILKWKNDDSVHDALPRLKTAVELLENADFSSAESVKQAIWEYAETIGKGELLWPLRVCLSGRVQSPDPFTLAFIIGQGETVQRIKLACDKISSNA